MARGNKDLAGLAALGALGYMLTRDKSGNSTPTRSAGYQSTETREEPRRQITDYMKKAPEAEDANYGNEGRRTSMATGRVDRGSSASMDDEATSSEDTAPLSRATPGSMAKRTEGNKPMPSLSAVERKAAARKASMSTDAMKNASRAQARRNSLSPVDRIPGQDRSGPTGGERVSGTELSRNVSNTMSALAPLGGGVGKIGAEMATAGRAQRAYNAAQAERRAAEGMSPAEALAARQAAREAKTLNPNAWLAGPKGMAENFRKGGMTASRRGDGIASRGKTRGKMY
jgi:hypothetical protein